MQTNQSVRLGQPENTELADFDRLEVDGITVYAHKALEKLGVGELEIDLEGLMFYQRLILRGLPVARPGGC